MKKMQFAPVVEDDDEITEMIKGDVENEDKHWQLKEDIDGQQLENFWDDALKDLGADDPE